MKNVNINVEADGCLAAVVNPVDVLMELALVDIIEFCEESEVLDCIGEAAVIRHFDIKVAE